MKSHNNKPSLFQWLLRLLLILFVLAPIAAVLFFSLREPVNIQVNSFLDALWQFFSITPYRKLLFHSPGYWISFWNTLLLLLPTLLITALAATLAAYGLVCAGLQRGQKQAVLLYILLSLLPVQILLVPNFLALSILGLIGSRLSVILIASFTPSYVYLCFRLCRQLPPEIFEAARLEGAGELAIYRRIALPQLGSGIGLLSLIGTADLWNMVEQPLIFLQDPTRYPLTLTLSEAVEKGVSSAGSILFALPVLLFFLSGKDTLRELEIV